MFFVLSKLLSFLLSPFNWIIILLLLFLFVKKRSLRKGLLITMGIVFILSTNQAIYYYVVHAWQINKPGTEKGKQYEAGIVLGGMTSFDKYGNGYLNESCDRFIETLKLYNQGVIKRIIVTGGSGSLLKDQPSEAGFIREELIANKVPPSDIYIEGLSKSTFENALFSKKLCDSLQLQGPYVLISSATHLRRAMQVFDKAGIPVVPYPASYEIITKNLQWYNFFLPEIGLMSKWELIIKEMIGIVAYRLSGKA